MGGEQCDDTRRHLTWRNGHQLFLFSTSWSHIGSDIEKRKTPRAQSIHKKSLGWDKKKQFPKLIRHLYDPPSSVTFLLLAKLTWHSVTSYQLFVGKPCWKTLKGTKKARLHYPISLPHQFAAWRVHNNECTRIHWSQGIPACSTSLLAATRKSLRWNTFYSACFSHVFIVISWCHRYTMSRTDVKLSSMCVWWCIVILSGKTDTGRRSTWATREQSVHWRALCVVQCLNDDCSTPACVYSLSCPLIKDIYYHYSNHHLSDLKTKWWLFPFLCHLSLIWLSFMFHLLPLLLLCLGLMLPWFQLPVKLGRMFGCHRALHSD